MAGESTIIEKVKAWAAPTLISLVAFVFWNEISEMKADVKKLVAESEYRRAKEEQMEKDIIDLKNAVYFGKKSVTSYDLNKKGEKTEKKIPIDFIHTETIQFRRNSKPVSES